MEPNYNFIQLYTRTNHHRNRSCKSFCGKNIPNGFAIIILIIFFLFLPEKFSAQTKEKLGVDKMSLSVKLSN